MKHSLLPAEDFVERRAKFFNEMPENSIAIFSAANELTRSNDTEYLFCQNKHFYYLTGFNEPDALLVLIKEETQRTVLFSREKDPLQEVWHGRRIGQEKAVEEYLVDECYSIAEIDELLPSYLNHKACLLYPFGENEAFESQLLAWTAKLKSAVKLGYSAPSTRQNASDIVSEHRLIKSDSELAIMRLANEISGSAHTRAMDKAAELDFEYQIEAEILHEFARHGARHAAYNSIVASGDNANILHYNDNCEPLNDGDLLLIDAGCELAGYAADITRTFPINGKFTPEQKTIYELVLKSQIAAIEAIKPGANFAQLNDIVGEVLTTGLFELGILKGELPELLAENACKKYFIHGLGHWLGLDVHDVGDYQANEKRRQLRTFEPNMVMTIEPGIYIPLTDKSVDEKWRGIGVRIEDNIAVSETGYENLTVNAPKTVKDIEAVMAKAS